MMRSFGDRLQVIDFTHEDIVAKLATLSNRRQVLFVASVAERLFPHAEAFFGTTQPQRVAQLRAALDHLWRYGAGEPSIEGERMALLESCVGAQAIAAHTDTDLSFFAENAAAVIEHGLNAIAAATPTETGWAAQRAYDTVDHFALMEERELDADWTEPEILGHPAVQQELNRQLRTIATLQSFPDAAEYNRSAVEQLREGARRQASSVLLRSYGRS